MTALLKNCRLISPGVDRPEACVVMAGKFVAAILPPGAELPDADLVVDARGGMAVPGFVDIHCHGSGGFDVTAGDDASIARIAELKLKEGVTTVIPTTRSFPEERLAAVLRAVAAYQQRRTHAKMPGVHLEGPFVNPACVGAMNPALVREFDSDEIARLNRIARVLIVSYAVEMKGGFEFTRALADMGIVPSCGHSAATYPDFLAAKKAGLKHLTHFCNQMSRLHHRDIGLVGAGLLDEDILLEIICDKVHLSAEMIALIFKCRPVEKLMLITDAIAASWARDGRYNFSGPEVEVRDGICRLVSSGALAGSTLRFYEALRNVHEITGLPLDRLIRTTGLNQAESLHLERIGKIEPGYFADIAILGADFKPVSVFVEGDFFDVTAGAERQR